MCCLFGILDPQCTLSSRALSRLTGSLAQAAEARGTDATGIAYNRPDRLYVYKRPLPAHRLQLMIPEGTGVVMGHTRLTTQGDGSRNYNNHPFSGSTADGPFALAHNGVLNNDRILRKHERLSVTHIETDSYVAVQMIEKAGELSFASLRQMAELLEGTFNFTVLDRSDALYIVKGNNPLCLYHWPKSGVYAYASTEEILQQGIKKSRVRLGKPVPVEIRSGELVRIDRHGRVERERFDDDHLYRHYFYDSRKYLHATLEDDLYTEDLKSVAGAFGFAPEDVDLLLAAGFTHEEIEDYFYGFEEVFL